MFPGRLPCFLSSSLKYKNIYFNINNYYIIIYSGYSSSNINSKDIYSLSDNKFILINTAFLYK